MLYVKERDIMPYDEFWKSKRFAKKNICEDIV